MKPADENSPLDQINNHLCIIKKLKDSLSCRTDVKMTINPRTLPQIDQIISHQETINRNMQKLIVEEIAWREQEIDRLKNNGAEN